MNRPLAAWPEGATLPPLPVAVSEAANDGYRAGAGIASHPAGLLYPPMAASLTILAVQAVDEPLLHTGQRLRCHRALRAPAGLLVRGRCVRGPEQRGREYAVVEAEIEGPDGAPLWSSVATFTPVRA